MLPQIIITDSQSQLQQYVENIQKNANIAPSHVYHISPLQKTISIDQIRDIRQELMYLTTSNRLFVIHDFHTAGVEAQNAFLKTLEEHNAKDHFILQSIKAHLLLPTILSRAQIVYLDQKKSDRPSNARFQEALTKLMSGDAKSIANPIFKASTIDEASVVMKDLIDFFRSKLSLQSREVVPVLKTLIVKDRELRHTFIAPQTVIDTCLLYIYKVYKPQ